MKSFGVTIQIKPLWQYFHMIPHLQNEMQKVLLNFNFAHFWESKVKASIIF